MKKLDLKSYKIEYVRICSTNGFYGIPMPNASIQSHIHKLYELLMFIIITGFILENIYILLNIRSFRFLYFITVLKITFRVIIIWSCTGWLIHIIIHIRVHYITLLM